MGGGARFDLAVASGGILLGRVWPAREPADLFGRFGRAGRRPPQERQRPGHSADRRRALVCPGIFSPGAGCAGLAARVVSQHRLGSATDRKRDRFGWPTAEDRDRDGHRGAQGQDLAGRGGPDHALAPGFERAREQRIRPRADRATLWRRRPGQDSPGAAPGGRGAACPAGPGDQPLGAPSQRRTQRLCHARDDPGGDGINRPAFWRGDARRGRDDGLHHPHPGRRRSRPVSRWTCRGAPEKDPRRAAPVVRRLHGARPSEPRRLQRALLHDGAGAQVVALRQRRQRIARRGLAAHVAAALPQPHRGERTDWPHHQRCARANLGCTPDVACSSTGISVWTGPGTSGCPRPGRESRPWTTPSSGRPSRFSRPG